MADVTVGFPVYNAADLIEESLRCILDGTYRDIRVLVSDNGSTDNTVEIVQRLAKTDDRIELVQQPENLGAVGNFRFVVEQAKTPYFLWRAHDDLSSPNFVEVLRQLMIDNDKAVLAVPHITTIKPNRQTKRPFTVKLTRNQYANWRHMLHVRAAWVFGMYRTDFARQCSAYSAEKCGHLEAWDLIMMLEALLTGHVTGTNEAAFTQRILGKPARSSEFADKTTKAERRQNVKEFLDAAEGLADQYKIAGLQRWIFKFYLWRYTSKRFVHWYKLL